MLVNRQNTQFNCMNFSFHVYFIFSMTMKTKILMEYRKKHAKNR